MKKFLFSFVVGFVLALYTTTIISSNSEKADYSAFEELYYENKAQLSSFNLKSLKECDGNTLNQWILLENNINNHRSIWMRKI